MGVEAARLALRSTPAGVTPAALWFSTASPAYLDKNNASTLHAALRLDTDVAAFDFGGALRSGLGALRTALESGGNSVLVVTSDQRGGLPTSGDESSGGDGAAALLVGDDSAAPVIAEYLGGASTTEEFIERWRTPGSTRSRAWEERFGEVKYGPLVDQAWNAALKAAELSADDVDKVIVTGMHARAARAVAAKLGTAKEALVDDRAATVGNTGSAHAALLLADTLESAQPGSGDRARRARRRRRRLVVPHHRRDRVVRAGPHRSPRRSSSRPTSRTASSSAGGARPSSSRRAVPNPSASPLRCRAAPRTGSTGSSAPATARAASCTCRRSASRASATPSTTWHRRRCRMCRERSRSSPSTASRTPPARRSCSRWSTGTVAAACRSSSPTSTRRP